ncbi:MAG: YfjI family protein, partial [Actinomycetota bacterium]|nr:YfjI family protein [Actinomycetota bacterium]
MNLARVLVATAPFVMLPPLRGGYGGSLNLFVALVGESGSGKGTAAAVAAESLDVGDITERHVGSGEGIPHLYAHRDRRLGVIRDRDAVLLDIPEVDNLTALGSRQGSTLLPVLRS